ncbi:HNH endonuclease [Streptomyces actuosus]|uniref:HNH endonuclease n=1 Tax=Streptomyces actuosus TaxID=1885 RepID=UPI003F688D96
MGRTGTYARETLATAVSTSRSWNELMRRLGLRPSGGQRRVLQQKVARLGIDTGHFQRQTAWRRYPDGAIADAVAASTTLREVALQLGATPASGTLTHLRRRIEAAGIDTGHFPGLTRSAVGLQFTDEELRTAAAGADSLRGAARTLGVPDDGRSRAALGRMLRHRRIDTTHVRHGRPALADDALRTAVRSARSYADVMRALGLDVTHTNHRRIRRKVAQLGLDISHFSRRPPEFDSVRGGTAPARRRRPRRPAARIGVTQAGAVARGPRGAGRTVRVRVVWKPRRVAGAADHAAHRPHRPHRRRLARQPHREPALPLPELPRPDGHMVPQEHPAHRAREPPYTVDTERHGVIRYPFWGGRGEIGDTRGF